MRGVLALALNGGFALTALAAERGVAEPPALALQYDFYDVQGSRVGDGSGNDHDGTLLAGTIVEGKRKPALQLAGAGKVVAEALGPAAELAGRALTVGAMCKPAAPDGVIVSMGDARDGFSLYLLGGVPHFAVRANGQLHEVSGSRPLDLERWVHVAGVIGEDGGLSLLVNAWTEGTAPNASGFLARTPAGPFTVGADAGTPVGPYSAALHWQGLLEDVRLYRGAIGRESYRDLLGDWADRPGCGCRK